MGTETIAQSDGIEENRRWQLVRETGDGRIYLEWRTRNMVRNYLRPHSIQIPAGAIDALAAFRNQSSEDADVD
jgi:hypothetical protein